VIDPLDGRCSVWAECLFIDPIADLAVLASQTSRSLFDEADAWLELEHIPIA
jgi:hypothetical protein